MGTGLETACCSNTPQIGVTLLLPRTPCMKPHPRRRTAANRDSRPSPRARLPSLPVGIWLHSPDGTFLCVSAGSFFRPCYHSISGRCRCAGSCHRHTRPVSHCPLGSHGTRRRCSIPGALFPAGLPPCLPPCESRLGSGPWAPLPCPLSPGRLWFPRSRWNTVLEGGCHVDACPNPGSCASWLCDLRHAAPRP